MPPTRPGWLLAEPEPLRQALDELPSAYIEVHERSATTLDDLDEKALVRILTEPKNALVKQYKRMFEIDGVQLEFTPDALDAVAEQAMSRGTGARGLRAILEEVLLPVMFDVPSEDDIDKVVITREVVLDRITPTIVRRRAA